MRTLCTAVCVSALFCGVSAFAQERPAPKDSTRVTIPGCVRGSTFIAMAAREGEPVGSNARPGQRFRLAASKAVLKDIGKQKASMVEVTGLIRKSAMGPGGISVLGGRVKIAPAMPGDPNADISRNPRYTEVVLDLESWQPLPDACPIR